MPTTRISRPRPLGSSSRRGQPPMLLPLVALLACSGPGFGPDTGFARDGGSSLDLPVGLTLPVAEVDECGELCAGLTGPAGAAWALESDLDGFLPAQGRFSDQGTGEACVSGLSPGDHRLVLHVEGEDDRPEQSLRVHPFGWAWGLDREATPPDPLPWVPSFSEAQLTAPPELEPEDGAWDSLSVLAPSTVVLGSTRFLYYAGTPDEDFSLGVATRLDGEDWVRHAGNPILTAESTGSQPGDWDHYAQNTPEALLVDGEVWLYYNGRAAIDGTLSIGLATSTDGLDFTRQGEPVLSPTGVDEDFDGGGVAHPSVLLREVDRLDNEQGASRIFELWYASGSLQLGYAISTDGRAFQRYCRGPVFSGEPGSFDRLTVKSPEVVYEDGLYQMTYSGCGQGCYQVGWAVSSDGVRWSAHDEPIIPTQAPPAWNSYGTQEAFIEVEGDTWSFWYAGTGESSGQIGLLQLER